MRVGLELSEEDLRRISRSHIPQDMDDKWFIFREETQLYFHRSWTGACIFVATIELRESGAVITEAKVNRDPKQHNGRDDYDALLIRFLIEGFLLGRNVPFPVPAEVANVSGVFQQNIVGTCGPEVIVDVRKRTD